MKLFVQIDRVGTRVRVTVRPGELDPEKCRSYDTFLTNLSRHEPIFVVYADTAIEGLKRLADESSIVDVIQEYEADLMLREEEARRRLEEAK